MYDKLEELFDEKEDIESFSPDNYFKDDHLLTLDDSKEYEKVLKEKLIDLSSIRISGWVKRQYLVLTLDKRKFEDLLKPIFFGE